MKKITLPLSLLAASIMLIQPVMVSASDRAMAYLFPKEVDNNVSTATSLINSDIEALIILSFGWDENGNIIINNNIRDNVPGALLVGGGYYSWTNMKLERPDKKAFISFGSEPENKNIWAYLDTPEKIQRVKEGLLKIMQTDYSVLKKNLGKGEVVGDCAVQVGCAKDAYQRAGYANLDGIDFYVDPTERLTEKQTESILTLIRELRSSLGDSKLIMLTTPAAGADPVACLDNTVVENCSYKESVRDNYAGSTLDLLAGSKDFVDFFNVKAYDVTESFDYKTAMANHKKIIGDADKILLGHNTRIQKGPDGYSYTINRGLNVERSEWQAGAGYGGFTVYGLGFNSSYITYRIGDIHEMLDAAKSANKFSWDRAINSLKVEPGKITVEMRKDVFDDNNRIILKKNGAYVAETYAGSVYYGSKTKVDANAVAFSSNADLKEGDILSVEHHGGVPGYSTNAYKIGTLSELKVTKGMIAVPEVRLTSVNVARDRIEVTLPKAAFESNNRLIIRQNGSYKGEIYAGKNYYTTRATMASGDVVVKVNTVVNAGDEITVTQNAGTPGTSTAVAFHTLYQKKASF